MSNSTYVSGYASCPSNCSSLLDIQPRITQFDFVVLLETWLKPGNVYNLSLVGFEVHCFNRETLSCNARHGSGGIVVYIRNEIAQGVQIVQGGNLEQLEDRVCMVPAR